MKYVLVCVVEERKNLGFSLKKARVEQFNNNEEWNYICKNSFLVISIFRIKQPLDNHNNKCCPKVI